MQRIGRRRAIVTGADSGIGKATVITLAEKGYDVGFTYLDDPDETRRQARQAGGRTEFLRMDLSDPSVGRDVVAELSKRLGGLDVFVNNAAIPFAAPFLETGLDDWQRVLAINLTGAFVCIQAAATRMIASGSAGRIIVVTSVQAHYPHPGSSAYDAAKGGLDMLAKVMAVELGPKGILVNAVAPGEITTRMSGMEGVDPTTVRRPDVPLGRPGGPQEIAEFIAWLASEECSYATGASFVVDGGAVLMGPTLAGRFNNSGRASSTPL